MADKLVWVGNRLHLETSDKLVKVGTLLHKETSAAAATPLDNDLISAMHFQRHYEPIAMGE